MATKSDLKSISKFLSYVLRHHPESINLELDKNGWAEVSDLIRKAQNKGKSINNTLLDEVLQQGGKRRFVLSEDGKYIRAGYGHSIDVDLQLEPREPPEHLYHGTADRNVASIKREGIHSANRNFVHLSAKESDARDVGSRHGSPVILAVNAADMHKAGHQFYQSESEAGIWLTTTVPVEFVSE